MTFTKQEIATMLTALRLLGEIFANPKVWGYDIRKMGQFTDDGFKPLTEAEIKDLYQVINTGRR